jgi:hypothetical protein
VQPKSTMPDQRGFSQLNIRVPVSTKARLIALCEEHGVPLRHEVNRLLTQSIAQEFEREMRELGVPETDNGRTSVLA